MRRNAGEIVSLATDGLLRVTTNAVLLWLFLLGASIGKSKTSVGAYKMFREAEAQLSEVNYDTFKRALLELRKKQLIAQRRKRSATDIAVTAAGRQRLAEVLPTYQQKRPWDGAIYLVSYDIAEVHHRKRDFLREYLQRISCGMLQESLWMTPYNPRDLVDDFVDMHGVRGTILVSKLGRDGALGDEALPQLLERVYQLSELNRRYRDFLEEVHGGRKTAFQLAVRYYAILADDPQLPFPLLPKDWQGERSYRAFQKLRENQANGRMSKFPL